ncbi:MAG: saccharopine dehydrogenase NADP-binding domain-containing protein [Bacteroidia bacterium]|nr:saccharopine dehydrogenase NADP-binding domain-containing protein [Bacteroidia bacterium]
MLTKDKILIVGGYGNVGRIVSKILANVHPGKVIVAGRSLTRAKKVIDELQILAIPKRLDIRESEYREINFDEIDTAICCIDVAQNDNLLFACIKHKVNYTEMATSFKAFNRLTPYEKDFEDSAICLVPGTGLMPGLSGVFVKDAISRFKTINKVSSFVLLGLGENHGLDSIRWMMDNARQPYFINTDRGSKEVKSFTGPVVERLLNEDQQRKFYRFNFGDQHIIVRSMNVNQAETRLAFDSRIITRILALCRKLGILTILLKITPKKIKKWLSEFRLGSEKFAVQTHCYSESGEGICYLANGANEARGSAIVAAFTIMRLYRSDHSGLKRLEELIELDDLVSFLERNNINVTIKKL